MSFTRPSLTDLLNEVQQDAESRLDLVGAVLRRSVVRILSRVIAGASHMLHGHIAWGVVQLFLTKCDPPYVLIWGQILGVPQNPAAFATGTFTATGTNGSPIPAGTSLTRSDGTSYTTQADATISSGTATVTVVADVAAADGDCDVGVVLSFVEPISGVDSTGTVVLISGGADQEAVEDYRARLLARLQQPPHGGNAGDYKAWAKEVPGVTRVWVTPNGLGRGTVLVYFMRDNDSGSPIPDSGEVATVQTYLNGKRPVTADVTVQAPIADVLNFTIHLSPDTSAIRTAVNAELADLIQRESEPGTPSLLSHIQTAIGNAVGDGDFSVTTPAADVTHSAGHIPTMGTVTYV